jgi:hypothetical protein
MRRFASFLLIGFALTAGATETWRWKDANGAVHYSDRPVPGAERIDIRPAPKPGSVAPPAVNSGTANNSQGEPASVPYTSCAFTSPTNDQVFNAVNTVSASLQLEPALQADHRVQVFLNGRAYAEWPEGLLYYTLTNLYRGSYTLGARVLDADGKAVCTGSSITYHVRQPSVLAPLRQQPTPRR